MNESKRKALTVIGCLCFAVPVAVNIFNLIQYRAAGGMLSALIDLLLVLALAFRSPLLLVAAGICLVVVAGVGGAVTDFLVFRRLGSLVALLQGAMNLVSSVLILLLGLSRRKSILLGWLTAALLFLTAMLVYFGWHIPALNGLPQQVTARKIMLSAATVVGWAITGCLRREMPSVGEAWGRLVNRT